MVYDTEQQGQGQVPFDVDSPSTGNGGGVRPSNPRPSSNGSINEFVLGVNLVRSRSSRGTADAIAFAEAVISISATTSGLVGVDVVDVVLKALEDRSRISIESEGGVLLPSAAARAAFLWRRSSSNRFLIFSFSRNSLCRRNSFS